MLIVHGVAYGRRERLTSGGVSPHLWLRSCFRSAVLPKRFLFGNVRVEVHEWGNQDVGSIHDLVAHDDIGKGHVVELLLGVRLHRLDLGLPWNRDRSSVVMGKY